MGTLSALARFVARSVREARPPPPRPMQPAPTPRRDVDSFTPATPARPPAPPAPVVPLTRAEDRATVKATYAAALQRKPTTAEVKKGVAFLESLRAQGKTGAELRGAMDFVIACTPEWQAKDAYRASLGREGTPDELAKLSAWGAEQAAQGKPVEELRAGMNFLIALTPEWQAKDAYRASLGREGTPDELAKLSAWGAEQAAQGKPVEELRAGMNFLIAMSPEWQAKDAYRNMLGREGSPEEVWNLAAWGGQQLAEGRPVPEMRAGMDFLIALSPEWQAKNPRLNADRDAIYLQQPNGWTCGPTSLAMALAASGVRPANGDTIWELVDALGARAGVGTPGGVSLIADVARRFGVNAEANGSTDPADVRAALERGHGVVVNGHLGGVSGHFLYLSGLDENGDYIVCDPWRPGIQRWNDGDLWAFTHGGPNPPGFAEVWPA
ncbi:MAG: C39 family peptidase [Myxococcaceae bacterium]|nr:C39 family peptidase [Myxococcaceae bacterium]